MNTLNLQIKAAELRLEDIRMIHKANAGHTGSSLSALDFLVALYYGEMDGQPLLRYDPKKPGWDGQDYVIMSKGHGCPAWYVVLADLGFFPKEELNHLRQVNSLLQGHPVRKIPGIIATTGSLGHGFSVANGLAMCLKMEKAQNRVYAILGDGELQEGQIWEAAMAAGHYKLDNLIAIVDKNELQIDGYTRSIMNVDPIFDKFQAFGWNAIVVRDGHNYDQLLDAFAKAHEFQRKPTVIIAHTVKAKGVSFAEDKVSYHGVALSKEEMEIAVPALEQLLDTLKKQL